MADLDRVRTWANALLRLHLDDTWHFEFDHAKRRAGLCNFTHKRITVSRYLAARFEDDEIHQVLLHEVAHALAGHNAGHGPRWKHIAQQLGYIGGSMHSGPTATELAPWVGKCSAGHTVYRHRKPTATMSCGLCSRSFHQDHVLHWTRREITAAARRAAQKPV